MKLGIYLYAAKGTLEVLKIIIRRAEEKLEVKIVILRKVNGTKKIPVAFFHSQVDVGPVQA